MRWVTCSPRKCRRNAQSVRLPVLASVKRLARSLVGRNEYQLCRSITILLAVTAANSSSWLDHVLSGIISACYTGV